MLSEAETLFYKDCFDGISAYSVPDGKIVSQELDHLQLNEDDSTIDLKHGQGVETDIMAKFYWNERFQVCLFVSLLPFLKASRSSFWNVFVTRLKTSS